MVLRRLEFLSYVLGDPPFDVKECQRRGLTFRITFAGESALAVILDKRSPTKPSSKEMKEQEVYMGELPLMTSTGSFVINGTERVIVSAVACAPQACFLNADRGKTHSSGKLLFSARSSLTVVHGWTLNLTRKTSCSSASIVAAKCL